MASPSAYYIERLCQLYGKSIIELGLSKLEDNSQAEQTNLYLPEHPSKVCMLPYLRNPFFLGREEILARLWHTLQANQSTAPSQPQAICGLGGVGKTQLALEYAYRHVENYQAILWTRADSRDALSAGYLQFAQALLLPERGERDQSVMIAAVKNCPREHKNWLMILDNADELSLLPDYLPAPMHGHLLLTTRAQALGHFANRVEIEMLNLDLAVLLLLRRAGLLAIDATLAQADQADHQATELLAWELGCLPLALDQAGAFLEETGCSPQEYLNLFRSHRADLLRNRGEVILDHSDSVATTLSLSFASVESRSALAADLLRQSSVLYPDAIPEELFLRGARYMGSALATIEADPLAFNHALAVIHNYSLLRRTSHERTLSIHRLVQAVIADAMSLDEREIWVKRAITTLNAIFPVVRDHGWDQWEACKRLMTHVLTSTAITTTQQDTVELASLLTKAADYLLQRVQYAQAEPLYQRSMQTWEQYLDQKHLDIPSPLNNFALLYIDIGNYQQAESLLERALHFEGIFGQENPKIAIPLNNLAIIYCQRGEFQQAEPLLQRALVLDEQTFGRAHPEVAFSLTNLADLYREQDWLAEAESLYRRALQIREQSIGPDHFQVAFPLFGLAELYRKQGRYVLAEPFYQRALAIRYQQRDTQHLETATILHDFARLHEVQNLQDKALRLYQQALDIRENLLGDSHPITLHTRTSYLRILRTNAQTQEAASLAESNFTDSATSSDQ